MQEKDKHKTYSKEELLNLMKEGKDVPADMDEFDSEALEGLKLIQHEDILDKLNTEVDTIVEEEKKKKKVVYYFSAAASLLLLIGFVFLFKNEFVSKDEKPLALAEKPKEESISPAANTAPQTETQTAPEDKEPQKEESKKDNSTALYKTEKKAENQYHATPAADANFVKEEADEANKLADETKPVSKSDVVTATGTSTSMGPPANKQEEQTIAANETVTNNNTAAMGGAAYGEKAKEKKRNSKNTQQPSQVAAGLSQSNTSAPNSPAEKDADTQESIKTNMFYAKDAAKNAPAKTYKEPAFMGGDTAFANYAKQNLNISSPDKSGIIVVSFLVTKSGTAQNIEVATPIPNCAACTTDVINLIKSVKKWQPAVMDGKTIDATKTIRVSYN